MQPCGLSFFRREISSKQRESLFADYREPVKNIVLFNKVFYEMSADDRRGQQVAHKVSSNR